MKNPYDVLGVSPDATDEEVKAAYREKARQYYEDGADVGAQSKMAQINDAYDAIIRERQGSAGNSGTGYYTDIRGLINQRRFTQAEELLDGIPSSSRTAEWYFLKGTVMHQKGWLEEAERLFSQAASMEPDNTEYQEAARRSYSNRMGGYRTTPMQSSGCAGCSSCDLCTTLMCMDCCCECMGGNLTPCCGCR